MSESHEPGQPYERRCSTPFEVWIRRSLHNRFDMVCSEKFPVEILDQFDTHGPGISLTPPHGEHDMDA
ncbi:hypothetical protein HPC44_02845 [Komagataeibacter oboediens]|uniref:Uncharacterized protein n=1 Tax=Komagataeibacter oboediens TaxID=65958 RepID=A0A318QU41_9PROT|nr:hypothetical protein [Komagataeibacter oboediens]MBT0677661.1 hypothetical protein [Komagataeibacter oboediens]PYD80928.1 hypothetical protein CFR80_13035 [Komagataeibacter oboediens]GCE80617.1 hypothetical protein MSKU3_2092 [Komagataeibacter oboediens]